MSENDGTTTAVVLDFLARGRSDDDRPRHQQTPIAYAVNESDFALYELELDDDAGITIGDVVDVESAEGVGRVRNVDYEDLSGGAQTELEYVVEDMVEEEEERFVDVYNDAGPITLRLHQLNLLPGIGKKLRNNILDERKRKPFESYEDLSERVSGLHDPKGVLAERILEEVREDDLKYRIFTAGEE